MERQFSTQTDPLLHQKTFRGFICHGFSPIFSGKQTMGRVAVNPSMVDKEEEMKAGGMSHF